MAARTLFDGEIFVHYGQFYVESFESGWEGDLSAAFAGQRNGLCGAAFDGFLFLITGLHTGDVGLKVELREEAPLDEPAWEEAVEVSFRPVSPRVLLVQWAGEKSWPLDLDLRATYRVRYSATAMDAAHAADTVATGAHTIDRYLLQFWLAAQAPDVVLRQTGTTAAYWHGEAPHRS
ncbi:MULTISPECIES: hypothetical protein [Pseudofrankia]|uniref:hypothetical protein n=1 Tax=Pseudofrankia TaxID=2994363 RepID=UPI000234DB1F|nr:MULTISPECIES: hypothetical protein [Pseudofrankia]OHV32832.1 hypothetical protein BCD49_28780 [Pseudofrankia sp. EUN1h]